MDKEKLRNIIVIGSLALCSVFIVRVLLYGVVPAENENIDGISYVKNEETANALAEIKSKTSQSDIRTNERFNPVNIEVKTDSNDDKKYDTGKKDPFTNYFSAETEEKKDETKEKETFFEEKGK